MKNKTNKVQNSPDHLVMTRELLDYAVRVSKKILEDASKGKLPEYK